MFRGPSENGSPGLAVALDRPVLYPTVDVNRRIPTLAAKVIFFWFCCDLIDFLNFSVSTFERQDGRTDAPNIETTRKHHDYYAVAYLGGGPRCDAPPLWPDHENFLRRLYMKRCGFWPFSSKNCKIQQCLMIFTRESRMLHASLPSSGRLSVRLSVWHTRDLYQNCAR